MAEQIPYGITQNLLTILGSNLVHEIGLIYGVRGELRKLENTLSTVAAVLLDAEEKEESSHAVAVWVRRLKDVVYDADDLLDDFATEELRRKTDDRGRFAGQVSDFFSSSNHLAFRFKMGHRIKAIRERLDDVANDISKFNFIPRVISDVPVSKRWRETCSLVEKSHKIVGREKNKKGIIELLIQSSSSQENLSMVVIVGMGGLGKTTLAQLVYNDQEVANYFGLKMWVCVSDDFDVGELLKNTLRSATNEDVENLSLEEVQKHLHKNLNGERYLLVLDDVWNEDKKKWGQFITLLPEYENGSKILATTRSTRVASVMGIDSPYIVEGLKNDESWELFKSLAFKKGEEQMHPNLAVIGKEIVKMCKGVPLVIETIGRILYFKTQESHWLSIKNNENLVLLGDKNDILSVLRLSYDNLPIHLKQCFAYCALFPKDDIIRKKELVQLWMAQGYIQPSHENECLEDVGDEYFEGLLTRSFFQEVEEKHVNRGHCYKMHDLIHDLAQSIAKSEVIILTGDVKTIPKRIHHMSLFRPYQLPQDVMGKPIRTLFMEYYGDDHYKTKRFISSLKYSRAMKVRSNYRTVLASLVKLSHLRYLDLSYGYFESLPNAITTLNNVQTLKLVSCYNLKEWPRNMEKLINLRHLEIDKCDRLSYMPRGLGESTKLQTLPLFRIGSDSWRCRHRRMRIGGLNELKFLNDLRGKLIIEGLVHARSSEAEGAIFEGKQYLECLRLYWGWGGITEATKKSEEEEAVSVMESLQPHPNLKEFFIQEYGGVRFPNWMMIGGLDLLLPNLVRIEMWFCSRIRVLPPFGQLPSLQYLQLWTLPAAEYMQDYSLSAKPFFPSLKTLKIYNMPNLKGWGMRNVVVKQAPPYSYLEDLQLELIRMELCLSLIRVSSSLKSLEIADVEDLISLPQGLRHLSTLQTLSIMACKNLASLPDSIGCLTSLTELKIHLCLRLTSLPKGMRSLRNLHTLEIYSCLYLSERCRKGTGKDWPQISHIPNIIIL